MMKFNHCEKKAGLTLIELLAVIVVLGIIASIAFVTIRGRIQKTRIEVCEVNRHNLSEAYHDHLYLNEIEHSDVHFSTFINSNYNEDICPEGGTILYKDGKVLCSIHSDSDNDAHEDEPITEEPVPFL
jgi:prepilin-type N-terminal cleavage/methylation domain-containing protein